MKKDYTISHFLFLFFLVAFTNFSAVAVTDLDIVITVSHYEGGSDVTCHGAHDGVMEAVIVGGASPYSYQWINGTFTAFTKRITGLAPGEYTFTVIDANNDTVSKSAKIYDVTALSTNPEISDYNGYNISYQGGDDGSIHLSTSGGVSPYSFLWSNSIQEENISSLSSGTYVVTITDANACVLTQSFTLTEPTPLHVVSISSPLHHGYNISCNGGEDGSIALSLAGGVAPYTYLWNSGDTTQNIDSLKGGTYTVQIHDANSILITRSISLTQPAALSNDPGATVYSNGKNTTCYNCSDGYITSYVNGGVSPYTYAWNTGQTTANLSGIIARNYSVVVTDQNGCHKTSEIALTQPDREDWTLKGNSGTISDSNYIGTNDNKDFRIKVNSLERMRWYTDGSIKITNGATEQFSIRADNKITIGAFSNNSLDGDYKLYVKQGIRAEKVKIDISAQNGWADYVFSKDYSLRSICDLEFYISEHGHLPDVPSIQEVKANGIDLAEINAVLLKKIEELTLYVIELNKQIEQINQVKK